MQLTPSGSFESETVAIDDRSLFADSRDGDVTKQAMRKLLRINPIPDSIYCYNDSVAIGKTRRSSSTNAKCRRMPLWLARATSTIRICWWFRCLLRTRASTRSGSKLPSWSHALFDVDPMVKAILNSETIGIESLELKFVLKKKGGMTP
jgi:hypothetical protein